MASRRLASIAPALVAASLLHAGAALAQNQNQSFVLDLPLASQRASVSQRLGLTSVTIDYHRPQVRGRKVWGELVPFGKVWRAGANENTVITFTDPVKIEGKPLAKGSYGLHMLPTETSWLAHTRWVGVYSPTIAGISSASTNLTTPFWNPIINAGQ